VAGLDDDPAGGSLLLRAQGYDHVNHATHDHKEEIKVGYNLNRKIVLMTIWALSPLVLFLDPTLSGRLRRGPRRLIHAPVAKAVSTSG